MIHVGRYRYFDFDDIFMALSFLNHKEQTNLKRVLKDHVPFVEGYHKKPWFKESDLIACLTERYPKKRDIRERIETFGIDRSIMHYAEKNVIFKLMVLLTERPRRKSDLQTKVLLKRYIEEVLFEKRFDGETTDLVRRRA